MSYDKSPPPANILLICGIEPCRFKFTGLPVLSVAAKPPLESFKSILPRCIVPPLKYRSLNFLALSPKSNALSVVGTMWPLVVRPVIIGVLSESICKSNLSVPGENSFARPLPTSIS